jgi:hypothetical protein
VIREFEFAFLTVGNPYRNGRRERISLSETMIYQWISLELRLMVKKDNVPRPYLTYVQIKIPRQNGFIPKKSLNLYSKKTSASSVLVRT